VGEQVSHGDRAAVLRKIGEDFAQRFVVAQLAVIHQQHRRHGGELLGE